MGASTDLRSSSAREMSLHKSFASIHNGSPVNSPRSPLRGNAHGHNGIGSDHHDSLNSLFKRDRAGGIGRRVSTTHAPRHNRRASMETHSPSPTDSRHKLLVHNVAKLPPLPFSSQPRAKQATRRSSQEKKQQPSEISPSAQRPVHKFQRRNSPLPSEMVTKLAASERKLKEAKMLRRRRSHNVSFNVEADQERVTTELPKAAEPQVAVAPQQQQQAPPQQAQHGGFRADYSLGQILRHPSHMMHQTNNLSKCAVAAPSVKSLNNHDFAFVKRSNGTYSYSILAYRSMEPVKGHDQVMEECLVFVMNDAGSTKMVRKRHWGQFVRLAVTTEEREIESSTRPVTPPMSNVSKPISSKQAPQNKRCPPTVQQHLNNVVLCQEVAPTTPIIICQQVEAPMPSVIVFDSQLDDECSLISSVSDRARAFRRVDLQQPQM